MSIANFVQILIDALIKKERLLDDILILCKQQEEYIKNENSNLVEYVECSDKKVAISKEIEKIDEGFISVYDRIKDEIETNPAQYADDIRKMQTLVKVISEKTASVSVNEQRLNLVFKKRVGNSTYTDAKYSGSAAQKYAQIMRGRGNDESTFINKKQ